MKQFFLRVSVFSIIKACFFIFVIFVIFQFLFFSAFSAVVITDNLFVQTRRALLGLAIFVPKHRMDWSIIKSNPLARIARMLVGILILIVIGNALTNFQLQRPTLELLRETLGSFLNGLNLTVNWEPIKSIIYDPR